LSHFKVIHPFSLARLFGILESKDDDEDGSSNDILEFSQSELGDVSLRMAHSEM